MELMLFSSARPAGGGPLLAHVAPALTEFLAGRRLLFVPYADADHATYTDRAIRDLAGLGVEVTALHSAPDPVAAVHAAEAMFVAGGNTFRLLAALQERGLVQATRAAVASGCRYVGSSAGACVASPNLRTSTDMPIVEPDGLGALALVPFQLVPHYTGDRVTDRQVAGFHRHNAEPVLGLEDGAHLRVSSGRALLDGTAGATLFARDRAPEPVRPGSDLSRLLH